MTNSFSVQVRLHQLALEVLHPVVAEHPVSERMGLFVLQQRAHAGHGAHLVEQMPILRQHIVFDVHADVVFVVPGGELLSVAIVHGLSHAIADGLAGIHIDRVDILIGYGQRLNQVVLGLPLLLLHGDPAQRAQHRAVLSVFSPLNRNEAAADPPAVSGREFLNNDGFCAQARVDGIEIHEAAHDRPVRITRQNLGNMIQRVSGVLLLAQLMAQMIEGYDLLKAVLLQMNVVDRKIYVAQRADDGGMLLFRSEQAGQLRIGLRSFCCAPCSRSFAS